MGWNLDGKKRKRPSTHNTTNTATKKNNTTEKSKGDSTKVNNIQSNKSNLGTQKKIWSFSDLVEAMKPTDEELKFRKGKSKEDDILQNTSKSFNCTKCQKNFKLNSDKNDKVHTHPCLGVLMCEECCHYYGDGEFSLDSEGEDKYCRWCGEGGTIFGCSKCICGFCVTCIKKHFGTEYLKKVQEDDDWLCFFCNPKPLWNVRYICSLAVKASENKVSLKAENGKKSNSFERAVAGSGNPKKTPKPKNRNAGSKNFSKNCILQLSDSDSSSTDLGDWTCESLVRKGKNNSKKRFYSSSSDESEIESPGAKKSKFSSRKQEGSSQNKEDFENLKQTVLDKLERVLKLSEYQLTFGVNWSSKMLKKLSDSKFVMTREGLHSECEKIKCFLSVLSTYLIEFCNSVDSVEKNFLKEDGPKDFNSFPQQTTDQTGFSAVMKFLSFITGQVNTFVKKGLSLTDILEAEIYDDDKCIGIKKNLKPSNSSLPNESISNSLPQTSTPKKGKSKGPQLNTEIGVPMADDDEGQDEDSGRLVVDQGSEVQEGDTEFTDLNSSCGTLVGGKNTKTSDTKEDILHILEILEHA